MQSYMEHLYQDTVMGTQALSQVRQNTADGSYADRAHGTSGAARHRKNRQLRALLKYERMTVAINLATIQHRSFMKSAVVEGGLQVRSSQRFDYDFSSVAEFDGASDETSSVIEYMSPTFAVAVAPRDRVDRTCGSYIYWSCGRRCDTCA